MNLVPHFPVLHFRLTRYQRNSQSQISFGLLIITDKITLNLCGLKEHTTPQEVMQTVMITASFHRIKKRM